MDAQIGLENTPEAYVGSLVEVFREVKRVLRDDGVLWLNLGDSFSGSPKGSDNCDTSSTLTKPTNGRKRTSQVPTTGMIGTKRDFGAGIKPKDLIGIPWMVAFALRADGWWLRSDVIWAKGSCMPESVTDRPTRSHEYVFLLTKSPSYFYDYHAVKEVAVQADRVRADKIGGDKGDDVHHSPGGVFTGAGTRNRRSVWTINPKPYKGSHFATMPPALAEVCVKAGTSEKGCCPTCGSPWERVVERTSTSSDNDRDFQGVPVHQANRDKAQEPKKSGHLGTPLTAEKGWAPTCKCPPHEPVPCTVLDPFSGSGTTGYVANRLGRHYVGTDLNLDYLPLAEARLMGMDPPETEDATPSEEGGPSSILDML